jgi:predicted deacylase
MNRLFITIAFLIFSALFLLLPSIGDEGVVYSAEKGLVGVYRLPVSARDILVQMRATVRHGKVEGDYIAELSAQEVAILEANGFHPLKLFDSLAEEDRIIRSQPEFTDFHSYTEMINGMIAYANNYPAIAQCLDLGNSVQGRELYAVKISDNVTIEENEPEAAFWGGVHGNEYGGMEMPYMYIGYLCENYGVIPMVTDFVNSTEIWCVPMINPDGRVNGTRNNANNIDLNREFGYNWDGWGSSPYPFSQVESRAVRELGTDNNLSISISYHCSGDEFYYPWGFFPDNAPDYSIFYRLAQRYGAAASYNVMSSYQSYQTHGEILDWAYGCLGGLSFTAEVSNSSANVNTTFDRNRAGMNIFLDLIQEGIHGIVTDSLTGEPLRAAVWLLGDPIPTYTDPAIGDLHRIVTPGNYSIKVWANGYVPRTIDNLFVTYGTPAQFTANLQPGGGEYAFMVVSVNQEDPNNAYNNATFPAWALGAPDGLPCSLGANGFIVLDMGEGHEIIDGPGDDFVVTEVIHPRDPNPEGYRIYAGDAYTQNVLIATAVGTDSFDLNSVGLDTVRYLKIVDQSGASPNLPLAGMDLDGVQILHSVYMVEGEAIAQMAIPADFNLSVYPNPFNSSTVIRFEMRDASPAELKVYDITGREVWSMVNPLASGWSTGQNRVVWNAEGLPSGIYFIRFSVLGSLSSVQKVMLLK